MSDSQPSYPRVLRYPIPVDDEWHTLHLTSDPLYVACKDGDAATVHLWTLDVPQTPPRPRLFRVFGTGHPLPPLDTIDYVGTAVTAGGLIVWHVFESLQPQL